MARAKRLATVPVLFLQHFLNLRKVGLSIRTSASTARVFVKAYLAATQTN